jgi:hypothetical protein
VPAQPVDATLPNQLIRQYFPLRIDPYGGAQSEPKQGFVLLESIPANGISLVDSYEKGVGQVLHRPIETTGVIGIWEFGQFGLRVMFR